MDPPSSTPIKSKSKEGPKMLGDTRRSGKGSVKRDDRNRKVQNEGIANPDYFAQLFNPLQPPASGNQDAMHISPSFGQLSSGATVSPILHMNLLNLAQSFAKYPNFSSLPVPTQHYSLPMTTPMTPMLPSSTIGFNAQNFTHKKANDMMTVRTVYPGKSLRCIFCSYFTSNLHSLMDHIDTHYPVKTHLCIHCLGSFPTEIELKHHLIVQHLDFYKKV